MVRSKKWLLATSCLAVTGGVIAAVMTIAFISSAERLTKAEKNADAWKRKTGKVYTALLRDGEAENSSMLIPQGARIECTPNAETNNYSNKSSIHCDGTIYPPEDY